MISSITSYMAICDYPLLLAYAPLSQADSIDKIETKRFYRRKAQKWTWLYILPSIALEAIIGSQINLKNFRKANSRSNKHPSTNTQVYILNFCQQSKIPRSIIARIELLQIDLRSTISSENSDIERLCRCCVYFNSVKLKVSKPGYTTIVRFAAGFRNSRRLKAAEASISSPKHGSG